MMRFFKTFTVKQRILEILYQYILKYLIAGLKESVDKSRAETFIEAIV